MALWVRTPVSEGGRLESFPRGTVVGGVRAGLLGLRKKVRLDVGRSTRRPELEGPQQREGKRGSR